MTNHLPYNRCTNDPSEIDEFYSEESDEDQEATRVAWFRDMGHPEMALSQALFQGDLMIKALLAREDISINRAELIHLANLAGGRLPSLIKRILQ